ncbi:MAG TPA: hypothetical protein VMB80_15870 [Candidatus Acidoferrum sp.]|nr:hypothetical protein [Candidatus Acidoferrum sp.]
MEIGKRILNLYRIAAPGMFFCDAGHCLPQSGLGGPGANPGFRPKNARRTLKEIGASKKRNSAPKSNPRPGTGISTPVFGCELFVAREKHVTTSVGSN